MQLRECTWSLLNTAKGGVLGSGMCHAVQLFFFECRRLREGVQTAVLFWGCDHAGLLLGNTRRSHHRNGSVEQPAVVEIAVQRNENHQEEHIVLREHTAGGWVADFPAERK